jgi:O-antigen/teichoic acid export membrane protein
MRLSRFFSDKQSRNSIISIVDQILGMGMGLALSILLARFLGAESLGVYTISMALSGVLIAFSNFGIQATVKRVVAKSDAKLSLYYGQAVITRILFSLPISLVLCWLFSKILGFEDMTADAVLLAGLQTNLMSFVLMSTGVLTSLHRNDLVLYFNVSMKFTSLIFAVYILTNGADIFDVLTLFIIVTFLISLLLFFRIRRFADRFVLKPNLKFIQAFISVSMPVCLAGVAEFLNLKIDNLILGAMTAEFEVGLYTAAFTLVLGVTYIPLALSKVYFPNFVNLYYNIGRIDAFVMFGKYCYAFIIYSFGCLGLLAFFGKDLLVFVYGNEFDVFPKIMILLSLSLPFVILNRLVNYSLIAIRENKFVFKITLVGLSANVATNILLIPQYSVYGAAVATIFTESIVFILGFYRFIRLNNQSNGVLS